MPEGNNPAESWDVFISFATPDNARAEQLKQLLDELGMKVFFAAHAINPGDRWQKRLAAAVKGSKVVAVLLSEYTADALYQEAEIQRAVQFARQGLLKLIPVYLNGRPQEAVEWDFEVGGFQSIDTQQEGLEETAKKLAAAVTPASPEPADREEIEQQTVGDLLHAAALRIDRTKQWEPLVRICRGQHSALFLLHGPRRQNLDLFVSRVLHYLPQECGQHHHIYPISLRGVGHEIPRSAAAWENHLRAGLVEEGRSHGTAEDMLREATRSHPIFLILSRLPIAAHDLDSVELAALCDFLRQTFPRLLAAASAGGNPIRALLATHYDNEKNSLVEELHNAASEGAAHQPLRYRRLQPLQALEWGDIEDFLDDMEKPVESHVRARLRAAFEEMNRNGCQFRDFVELLEQQLYLL